MTTQRRRTWNRPIDAGSPRAPGAPRLRTINAGSPRAPGAPRLRTPTPGAGQAAPAPTTRLDETFDRLRARGERALVAYFTAGDPSLADTRRLVAQAERSGADVIELGVPFSDPLADGPVIQRAATRALAAGTTLPRVLETVATLRAEVQAPIVLLTYYNPVLAFGLKAFARTAADAGVAGVIVADLPLEEADPLDAEALATGLDLVFLVAPTSTTARARAIARRSRGFIYLVSLTGVTGARRALPPELEAQIRMLRLVTTKPVCVGFGISSPEQVAAIGRLADGAIVGSAIVRLVEQHAGSGDLLERVGEFIASLKAPLRAAGSGSSASTTPATSGGARRSDVRSGRPPGATGLRGATRARPRPDTSQ